MSPYSPITQELDPAMIKELFWPSHPYRTWNGNKHPGVRFYDKQWEMVYSVWDNDETIVVAGNMLGKDFGAGFIAPAYFLHPLETRIITTSVKDDHLRVLWGEIMRFINTAQYPLTLDKGGPFHCLHRDIYKVNPLTGELCDISYLRGMVSLKGEGLTGHHAARTMIIGDECSGLDDQVFDQVRTWAKKEFYFGNPNPTENMWRQAIKGGDILADI